ncbi:MAG: tetratricopeptide repeat protein [Leptolyngbyaceae cyanobacterium T60_A2020_046]|nr:tetratricopeptide repeat protein [Leptolyngbyaceae cyanobacterium T60_A2020_046]
MSTSAFPPDWIKKFSDPYAVLGVVVTADEQRILKRYRQIAKLLHPDKLTAVDADTRELANQILARLVNPAYQRLKLDKGRAETLATLRFKVRRLLREEKLIARSENAKHLLDTADESVDLFYEQALSKLSLKQYNSLGQFAQQTAEISELNLIYLRRKMGDPVIREKRTGLVASSTVPQSVATPAPSPSMPTTGSGSSTDYAQRHVSRGKIYIAKKKYPEAIQEFRDAVRIEPSNSDYHTMLGQAYLLQKMMGMAKVHIRQALKLNIQNPVARKYAQQLEIALNDLETPNGSPKKGTGLFGRFARRR